MNLIINNNRYGHLSNVNLVKSESSTFAKSHHQSKGTKINEETNKNVNKDLWSNLTEFEINFLFARNDLNSSDDYIICKINIEKISNLLNNAGDNITKGVYLSLPDPFCGSSCFKVWRNDNTESSLKKEYIGFANTHAFQKIRLDFSQQTLKVMIISDQGEWSISSVDAKKGIYIVCKK